MADNFVTKTVFRRKFTLPVKPRTRHTLRDQLQVGLMIILIGLHCPVAVNISPIMEVSVLITVSECCCFVGFHFLTVKLLVSDMDCLTCNINMSSIQRPNSTGFEHYLPFFLEDNPDEECAKGGHAAYGNAVNYVTNMKTQETSVEASYFMAYHKILKTSADYYEALRSSRKISHNITQMIQANLRLQGVSEDIIGDVKVFPYSVFYVFYEQYLTMWPDTLQSMGISILAIFVVTFLLMGFDIHSSIVVVITITMIVINIGGLMYWWSISLNAVSLVNLVMAVGISVEFCSHLVHSFSVSIQETREKRAADALTKMGSSVFSGITLTKFGGILVLGFAQSQIFKGL